MHLFKAEGVKDAAAAAAAIPVIDFGPYFAGEAEALEKVATEVGQACEHVGFFYAAGHGVDEALIDRAFAAARRFHALPIDEKLALRLNENNIGYLAMNASVQGASTVHKATRPNQNESFFVSHDRGADHPDVVAGLPLRGRNQWPDGVPGLREDMMAYFAALGAMCDRILPAFAVALGMEADFFGPFFANEAHANMRCLHYPPQDSDEDNLFGQAPHTDNSFMTALARTEVPGLAVRLASGEWFAPPIIPGTFLINLGNIMRRWSNNRFLSTPHGVLNESGADRYSIAYFHSPNPAATIECLPSCVSADNPAKYPKAVYRDLVLDFYRANYFHQKGHASDASRLAAAEMIVEKLSPHTGAEVRGVDLREKFDAAALNQAFVDHSVLVVRDQKLTAPQLLAAVQQLGDVLQQHNTKFALPECPLIHYISNEDTYPDGSRYIAGDGYHTDHSNAEAPPKATILCAVSLPDRGGDTQYVNMHEAYSSLDAATRAKIEGRQAIHVYQSRYSARKLIALPDGATVPDSVAHPLVRTHPESGRKALYLNPIRTEGIVDMDDEEGLPLLDALLAHAVEKRHQYRHKWQPGDVVMWDNRCLLHKANGDYDMSQLRYMYRVMLQGDVPR